MAATQNGEASLGECRKLMPSLSFAGAWAFGVGSAIGWGSFVVTSNQYLLAAGPAGSIAALVAGTALMLVIARCYAYLMNRYPNAGGAYTYARNVLGSDYGFLVAWFMGLSYLSVLWANATSLPLFVSIFLGNTFKVLHLYTVFGYDVYLGEALLTIAAIVAVHFVCAAGKRLFENLMTGLAILYCICIFLCFAACFVLRANVGITMQPYVLPNQNVLEQLLSVTLMTPWAYIGFESISHGSEEFAFERKRSKHMLRLVVLTTFALYVFLILLSVSAYPARYQNWMAYLQDLPNLHGIEAIPPFFAARHYLGELGVNMLLISLFALVASSLVGLFTALSRLLFALGRDGVIPASFAALNQNDVPQRAVAAVVAVSLVVPFLGRTAIGWIVDITTIGAVIVYGMVSATTILCARREGNRREEAFGIVSAVAMGLFGLITLLPSIFADESLAQETYFLVTVWCVLGFAYYRMVLRNDHRAEYGKTIAVWAALLSLVLFTSTVWLQKSDQRTMDKAIMDVSTHIVVRDERQKQYVQDRLVQANKQNERSSLMITGMFVLALATIMSDYRYVRRREEQMGNELGAVREVAYRDSLTGVKSRNSFREWEDRMDEAIARSASEPFAVLICDVNGLKTVNDTQGHAAGDLLIQDAARMVCECLKHSPVFRIGGDEFAAILTGKDYEMRHAITQGLRERVERNARLGGTVVALGISDFDQKTDALFQTVFMRADEAMYIHKRMLKGVDRT